jgi:hypothetical protein
MTEGCRAAKLPDPPTAINILTLRWNPSAAPFEASAVCGATSPARTRAPMIWLQNRTEIETRPGSQLLAHEEMAIHPPTPAGRPGEALVEPPLIRNSNADPSVGPTGRLTNGCKARDSLERGEQA